MKRHLTKEEIQMANKYIKRCSIYVTRKLQIKTTRYHYTPIRIAKIQNNPENTKCRHRCGVTDAHIHCWWECKMVQSLYKTVWQFLTKLNILLPYDLAITLVGIYLKELKTHTYTKTYTQNQHNKSILKKKRKKSKDSLSAFKTYYIATVIMALWYWQRDRQTHRSMKQQRIQDRSTYMCSIVILQN